MADVCFWNWFVQDISYNRQKMKSNFTFRMCVSALLSVMHVFHLKTTTFLHVLMWRGKSSGLLASCNLHLYILNVLSDVCAVFDLPRSRGRTSPTCQEEKRPWAPWLWCSPFTTTSPRHSTSWMRLMLLSTLRMSPLLPITSRFVMSFFACASFGIYLSVLGKFVLVILIELVLVISVLREI